MLLAQWRPDEDTTQRYTFQHLDTHSITFGLLFWATILRESTERDWKFAVTVAS
jgi:hypothetical protein